MKVKLIALALISVVLVGCTTASTPGDDASSSTTSTQSTIGREVSLQTDFAVGNARYLEENTWSYQLGVEVPTPCHDVTTDVIVAESFPEQVTIRVAILESASELICAQVIDTKTVSGTFSASEEASVTVVKQ